MKVVIVLVDSWLAGCFSIRLNSGLIRSDLLDLSKARWFPALKQGLGRGYTLDKSLCKSPADWKRTFDRHQYKKPAAIFLKSHLKGRMRFSIGEQFWSYLSPLPRWPITSSLWTAPRSLVYSDKISCHWVQGFPSNESVEEGDPLKRRHFAVIGSNNVKTVVDRYIHAAYHNKHW